MNKLLVLQAALYTGIAALTPLTTALSSDTPLTPRYIICLAIGSIIAGATALKAFLSTNFSDSGAAVKPIASVKIDQPDEEPIPVTAAASSKKKEEGI